MSLYLRATANFADGSSQDITTTGVWVSSNPAAATVGASSGIVVGVADGQTDVTITYKGVSAVAHVPVGIILEAIDIPLTNQLGIGIKATFQFSALGQFTDGARDVSKTVTWTSSDPSVASVSNAPGKQGVTTGLAPGPVTITASSGSVSQSVSLTVLPIQSLEQLGSDSKGVQLGGLGVDSSGRVLAIWNHRFSPAGTADLLYAGQSPAADWTQSMAIRTVPRVELASPPHFAMNANGVAVAAWQQIGGLFATTYSPSSGWTTPVKVTAQVFDEPEIGLGIDGAGNALLTWKALASAAFLGSAMDVTTGLWSAPTTVPGSDSPSCIQEQAKLVMGATGQAVLAWGRNCYADGDPPLDTQELLASSWTAAGGWRPAEQLESKSSPIDFTVACNDAGDTQVAWIVFDVNSTPGTQNPFLGSIFSRRFSVSGAWAPRQTIASGLTRQPRQPMTAINVQGKGVLAWHNGYDVSVSASLADPLGNWTQPIDLYLPNDYSRAGDPTLLKPSMTDDGRVLVSWIVEDQLLLGKVAMVRYVPGAGWEQGQLLTYTGRTRNLFGDAVIEFNRQGLGAILWLEQDEAASNVYAKALSF